MLLIALTSMDTTTQLTFYTGFFTMLGSLKLIMLFSVKFGEGVVKVVLIDAYSTLTLSAVRY